MENNNCAERKRKTVLILGDSISMGYREYVKEALADRADVVYFEENGRFAKYTLHMLNQYIRLNGVPDIVHWNNGIWDLTVEPPLDGNFTPLPEYVSHLKRIIWLLREAKVGAFIFATSTFAKNRPEQPREDTERYNAAALAVMADEGVEVNDLATLVKENLDEFICEDNLHLNETGYRACAAKVVKAIESHL